MSEISATKNILDFTFRDEQSEPYFLYFGQKLGMHFFASESG